MDRRWMIASLDRCAPNLIVREDEAVHEILRAPRRILAHPQVHVVDRNLQQLLRKTLPNLHHNFVNFMHYESASTEN